MNSDAVCCITFAYSAADTVGARALVRHAQISIRRSPLSRIQTGDLFASDADGIVHCEGAYDSAGASLSQQFQAFQPASSLLYEQRRAHYSVVHPQLFVTDAGPNVTPRWILHITPEPKNLEYTPDAIIGQLTAIAGAARRFGIRTLAFPWLGDRTPGPWQQGLFAGLVEQVFSRAAPEIEVVLMMAEHHVALATPVAEEVLQVSLSAWSQLIDPEESTNG